MYLGVASNPGPGGATLTDSHARPRIALAFAYDGTRFDSFARQPGRRTIEGELLSALVGAGAIASAREARYEAASRTDRGVSAHWNVCAFDSGTHPGQLANRLHTPEGLLVRAAAVVEPGFSPRRSALWRRYAYRVEGLDAAGFRSCGRAARRFVGQHDFASFCRPEPGVSTARRIDEVSCRWRGAWGELRFRAQSFLWEQVRRMVHGALDVGRGIRTEGSLVARLASPSRRSAEPPAASEPLVLEHVELPIHWTSLNRSAARGAGAAWAAARAREWFYAGLARSEPTARR